MISYPGFIAERLIVLLLVAIIMLTIYVCFLPKDRAAKMKKLIIILICLFWGIGFYLYLRDKPKMELHKKVREIETARELEKVNK